MLANFTALITAAFFFGMAGLAMAGSWQTVKKGYSYYEKTLKK